MNTTYEPTRRSTRILLACAALIASAATLGSVLGLDVHYDDEFLRVSHAQQIESARLAHTAATESQG